MSNTINLDAKRAARRATRGDRKVLEVDGHTIQLRQELPLSALDLLEANELTAFMQTLVHPDAWDEFKALNLSMDDVMDIVGDYMGQVGESAASIISSINTGKPSRPTSNGSTDSTSPTSSGATSPLGLPASST